MWQVAESETNIYAGICCLNVEYHVRAHCCVGSNSGHRTDGQYRSPKDEYRLFLQNAFVHFLTNHTGTKYKRNELADVVLAG